MLQELWREIAQSPWIPLIIGAVGVISGLATLIGVGVAFVEAYARRGRGRHEGEGRRLRSTSSSTGCGLATDGDMLWRTCRTGWMRSLKFASALFAHGMQGLRPEGGR